MKVKFDIVEDNILNQAKWADAIVNCANNTLCHGGGICNVIFEAAGPELDDACKKIGERNVTECVITDGYNIPCRIIHAVSKRFNWNETDNEELLRKTYQNVINLAERNNIEKIVFPLIASNIYAYPLRIASKVAVEFLNNVQSDIIKEIRLVLLDRVYYLACREALLEDSKKQK